MAPHGRPGQVRNVALRSPTAAVALTPSFTVAAASAARKAWFVPLGRVNFFPGLTLTSRPRSDFDRAPLLRD